VLLEAGGKLQCYGQLPAALWGAAFVGVRSTGALSTPYTVTARCSNTSLRTLEQSHYACCFGRSVVLSYSAQKFGGAAGTEVNIALLRNMAMGTHAVRTSVTSSSSCAGTSSVSSQLLFATDSHDDFKPHPVAGAPKGVMEAIKEDVQTHDVMLYMKVRGAVSCMSEQVMKRTTPGGGAAVVTLRPPAADEHAA
jgi:hypothetical protein